MRAKWWAAGLMALMATTACGTSQGVSLPPLSGLMTKVVLPPGASQLATADGSVLVHAPTDPCRPSTTETRYWSVPGTPSLVTKYLVSRPIRGLIVGPHHGFLAHGKSPAWYLNEDVADQSPSTDSFIYWYMPTKHGTVEVRVDASVTPSSADCNRSKSGLIPSDPALHDHIELSTNRVQAGSPLTAKLVIVNDSSKTINLSSPCRPLMDVILANQSMPPSAIGTPHPGHCLTTPVLVHPGTTVRYLGVVPTTYLDCTASPGQQVVQCMADGRIPPLPPGRYYAVLTGDGLALPPPTPVAVDVTPS